MPYPMTHEGDKWCVNGKCYDNRAKALAYQRALHVNVPDAGKKELEVDAKYYDSYNEPYYGASRLSQDDSRVDYGPLKGTSTEACANCHFFDAGEATCDLVWGDIVATGYCDLWLTSESPPPEPMKVTIVKSAELADSPVIAWLKKTFGKKDEPLADSGFKALADNKWVSYYSNNFEDKTGQIFSERSHDQYIEWLDKGLIPMPDLWDWHVPGTHIGQAEWIGRIGHLMIAAGSFDDTKMAQLFRKEYERHPHRVSHTYGFPPSALQNGVYQAYFTVEISPLPAGKEANAITTFMEVKEMPVTAEKKTRLEAILGKELAASVLTDADRMSSELEKLGLKFKEAETTPLASIDTGAREAVQTVAVANKAQNDTMLQHVTQIGLAVKALTDNDLKRQKQIDDLVASVKEMFDLQPKASTSTQTIVDPNNPMAALLKEKAAGEVDPTKPPASGNVFDWLAGMTLGADKK